MSQNAGLGSATCDKRGFVVTEAQLIKYQHRVIFTASSPHKMPMESERLAEEHQRKELTAHSYSLVTAALALVMITVGSVYWEDCK